MLCALLNILNVTSYILLMLCSCNDFIEVFSISAFFKVTIRIFLSVSWFIEASIIMSSATLVHEYNASSLNNFGKKI